MRLIKKYPNRKLYDTVDKRYVSLFRIASLVRDGEEVKVVDNQGGEDITALVLTQILREQERQVNSLPHGLLTALVQSGALGLRQVKDTFPASLKALEELEEQIRQRIDALASRGEISLTEAQEWREQLATGAQERQAAAERRIIQQIEESLVRLDVPTQAELEGLLNQLQQIEAKVDGLLRDQGLAG